MLDIFQDLLKCNSEKVLLELLWPPLPSIISPISNFEEACNILTVIFVSATNSDFAEPIIALLLNQMMSKMSTNPAVSGGIKSTNQVEAWTNWEMVIQELAKLSVHIFNSTLDSDFDKIQLKESLTASTVKYVKDLALNI